MQVLVADDDPIARAIEARALTEWGFEVTSVADGAEVWRRLRSVDTPTLLILDWMMPWLTGPEICRLLRRAHPLGNVYVVLVTSREDQRDVIAGLEAGADDYMLKPVNCDELRARVQVGVRVLTLQERLSDRIAALEVALANVRHLRGLLPICSYCKSIRGDDQYWQQVEQYIAEHSDAKFTHGVCPRCFEQLQKRLDQQSSDALRDSNAAT